MEDVKTILKKKFGAGFARHLDWIVKIVHNSATVADINEKLKKVLDNWDFIYGVNVTATDYWGSDFDILIHITNGKRRACLKFAGRNVSIV